MGVILTMNVPLSMYESMYKDKLLERMKAFDTLNGTVEVYPCCDTLQVEDYSKYNMAGFSEDHKKAVREKQFPLDLEYAFKMGARLSQ